LGLVTLGESLIASPSSLAFFPSAFFAAFSYRFASSCLSLYSCNIFPVLVVVLIAASCTEMEIGGASMWTGLKSLHGTQRGSVARRQFLRRNLTIPSQKVKDLHASAFPIFGHVQQTQISSVNYNKLLNYFCQYNCGFMIQKSVA
jgi:hypothetical protein